MLQKMTLAAVLAVSSTAAQQPSYDQFLAEVKQNIDVDLLAKKVKQKLQEKEDNPRKPGYRENMIQDMLDDVADLVENDANDATWKQFRSHYKQKWDKYNKAINGPGRGGHHSRSSRRHSSDSYLDSFASLEPTNLASYKTKMSYYDKLTNQRIEMVEDQIDEYEDLVEKGATKEQFKKWQRKWKDKWRKFGHQYVHDAVKMDGKNKAIDDIIGSADEEVEVEKQEKKPEPKKQKAKEKKTVAKKKTSKKKKASEELISLLDAFSSSDQSQQFWGSQSLASTPSVITVQFDNTNNQITVASNDVDANNKPIHEWQMDQQSGLITQIERSQDGSEERTTHKNYDVSSASNEYLEGLSNEDVDAKLQQQRDMTYMIMNFFAIFFVFFIGLIYAFVQLNKLPESESKKGKYEHLNRNVLRSRAFEGKLEHLVNRQGQDDDDTSGFGTNNLYHLSNEEKGRFDDLDTDNLQKTVFRKY